MLNESLLLISWDEIKNVVLHELTIFHVALVYVLLYVVYKALGRYIYFKPQEHGSKINRTFLTLSLCTVLLHVMSGLANRLPFAQEYRWLFMLCWLVLLIAPLSILMDRIVWKYDYSGGKSMRGWVNRYLPVHRDYYKTNITKQEREGNFFSYWEEEGVESTKKNLHSDALLNVIALIIFVAVCSQWAHESAVSYGWPSYVFSAVISFSVAGIFLDRAVFSWINYLERATRKR